MRRNENLDFAFEPQRTVFSVSALNQAAREAVESGLGSVWVEGEISNLARPSSGHLYWSLKDENAQVRCAMFRQYGRNLTFAPENGQHVVVRARASIYEARGEFQLVVDYMEEAGEGVLRRKFEVLKAKLAAEGLFDASRKKPLPPLPERIGVITSPTGAAIHDVLTALKRRFPAVPVLIYPSAVQGEAAAAQLAKALRLANARNECDLLILARGGGSLEDLWAFNEETLARAISESRIPVISGVGHETDFTIADFVADLRAPTPSQAAELAVPNQAEWRMRFAKVHDQLVRMARQRLREKLSQFHALQRRLARSHPGVELRERAQRLDDAEGRLRRALVQLLGANRTRLEQLRLRLASQNPLALLALRRDQTRRHEERLGAAMRNRLAEVTHRFKLAAASLQSLSPLATLERGYAIVTIADSGRIVTRAKQAPAGATIGVRLASGRLTATVDSSDED